MLNAARDAKRHTSWRRADDGYESALINFVKSTIGNGDFQTTLRDFVTDLIEPGRINSLAQCLIKLTHPGVPDTYQGTELWDLSLVDPDNRRPVDHDLRISLLAHADETPAAELWALADDGAAKMLVTSAALRLRRQRPASLLEGTYTPLEAEGEATNHVVAFMRAGDVAVVVPRLVMSLGGEWGDTTIPLPEGKWRNVITDERVYGGNPTVGMMLGSFPVALLAKDD
jgi:(1->4)-alpha-D-glucan 1-alpha-D-glucosylmutase